MSEKNAPMQVTRLSQEEDGDAKFHFGDMVKITAILDNDNDELIKATGRICEVIEIWRTNDGFFLYGIANLSVSIVDDYLFTEMELEKVEG